MANVSHASLTGANLHEPKGVASAISGQVYVADGAGSGAWTTVAGLTFTGLIADFATPIAPSGWLECDGTAISRTTYSDLFTALTIQQTGTRVGGLTVITGLSSTTNMKAGYYVGGTGITNGSTIVSVDSSTQITISNAASGSGSSTVIVSPWAQGNGTTTFTLPDLTTSGRFRRSRTSSTVIGANQADQNSAHTHTATTSSDGAHTHTINITDPGHTHTVSAASETSLQIAAGGNFLRATNTTPTTSSATTGVTAASVSNGAHTHTLTTASSGSSEARPLTTIFMTCIKY